jgi:hypothetical protein
MSGRLGVGTRTAFEEGSLRRAAAQGNLARNLRALGGPWHGCRCMTIAAERPEPLAVRGESPAEPGAQSGPQASPGLDRRRSGQRNRVRDKLLDRGSQPTEVPAGALARVRDIENLLLFIDDDLRETALALTRIEDFLGGALETLADPQVRREHILTLASDVLVLGHLDQLSETLESLRRRLARLSSSMK